MAPIVDTTISEPENTRKRRRHWNREAQIVDEHRTLEELEAGLPEVGLAPRGSGTVELVVRRPNIGLREVLDQGELDAEVGLVGDRWSAPSDSAPHPETQLTLMNARAAALIAGSKERWPLAGDQLYVDFDISAEHLPAGTRLAIGTATIEVTAEPHLGCAKFSARFGTAALRVVNQPAGRALRLRGVNARVVEPGSVAPGDSVRKL